jgi:beta-lactamase regulating signal transducer with metallopeptidase domain
MIWPQLQVIAQTAVSHIVNSLPEGMLIAVFAWMMLRLLPRQNSGTRFSVWFVALLSVAALPFIGSATAASSLLAAPVRPLISLPERWGLLLFLAWVLAVNAAMVRLGIGLWRVHKLRKSCVAVDVSALDPTIRKTIAGFSASRSVNLAASESVSVPSAIGFFQPMIVVPSWALRELPPEELNIILLHEFAHLRRWDDWSNLLQKIVRAVFFFHPAVWWIENRLSIEREMACDDVVLAETGNPRGYAKCLVDLLEKSFARRGLAMAQAAVHRAHEASLRLAQILDAGRPNSKRVWKPALACVGTFSVLCLGVVARAPQFVAFERSPQEVHSAAMSSSSFGNSQFPGAMVIPAALRTSSLPSLEKDSRSSGAPVKHRAVSHHAPTPPAPSDLAAGGERGRVQAVNARLNTKVHPTETLLLIRTAQQTGPDSWTWSVSVWRVIWTNPAQSGAEKAPVAHKT